MRPRWQKVWADLWGNPLRSLLVLASIAVGLFALGVITTIYVVGPGDMQTGFVSINPANIYVSAALFEQGLVDRIQKLPGVNQAVGERDFSLRFAGSPGEWVSIGMHTLKDPENLVLNKLSLVEGTWPPGDGEVVIDHFKLADTHASLGDMISFELPSGRTRQLKLVGVVQDQTIGAFGGAGGFFNAPVQGYVNRTTLELLEQPQPKLFNSLYVTVTGDSRDTRNLDAVALEVRNAFDENNIDISSTSQHSSYDHPNLYLARAILAVLVVIGLLVVLLSGFLITNTMQALLNQQVQQIGILKTIGARRMQVASIYLTLSLLFGILAFFVAVPLTYLVSFRIVQFLSLQTNSMYYGPRLVFPVILLQAVLALLMPQIAALIPVWQGTRISVQEALSGISQHNPPAQGWLDRRLGSLRKYSLLLLVSLRNTFRHKWRLLLTVFTLTLGGAIFIATFNVRVSMLDYVDRIIQYFVADVNIDLDRSYPIDEIDSLAREVPGVRMAEGWAVARSEIILPDDSIGDSVFMLAPPANSTLIKPVMLEGRWIQPGDRNAIALSELFHERLPNLKVGDTLRLRVNDKDTDWVVVGFFQLAGKISGLSAYSNYEYVSEVTHQPGRAAVYRVVSSQPNLTESEQEALGRAIEAHLKESGIKVTDINTGLSRTVVASQGFNVLTALLLFLALLTALVGSIGLAGTMSMNVMERTREIGILRAIGAADKVLMRIVLIEGLLIGLISWFMATLLSFPISKIMSDSIAQALFGSSSNFGFTPIGLTIWFVMVAILSFLASVLPARSATHLTIREVLSYE